MFYIHTTVCQCGFSRIREFLILSLQGFGFCSRQTDDETQLDDITRNFIDCNKFFRNAYRSRLTLSSQCIRVIFLAFLVWFKVSDSSEFAMN